MKKIKIFVRIFNVYIHGHYSLIRKVRRRINRAFIDNLQLLQPNYYHDYVKKYGNEDWTWWVEEIGKNEMADKKYSHFENGRTVESTEAGEPVTITINKDSTI